MQRFLYVSLLVGLSAFVVGCQQTDVPPPATSAEAALTPPSTVEGFVIGPPIRHANLTIFPLSSPVPKTEDRFITLDSGLKSGEVQIMELGSPAAKTALTAAREEAKEEPDFAARIDLLLD